MDSDKFKTLYLFGDFLTPKWTRNSKICRHTSECYIHTASRILNDRKADGMAEAEAIGPDVLVTGSSGYIAAWVTRYLLEAGYRVRGTVRDLGNARKVDPLRKLCPGARYPLELVEADLTKPHSWDAAVSGCRYVMHIASPFPKENPRDPESELIKPAVEGTTNVLKACHRARVSKVVLTSSIAAISGGWGDPSRPDHIFTEADWPDETKQQHYERSKILAERAAWEFLDQLPEEERFEMAVINPVYVIGPILSGSNCTSMEVARRLILHEIPAVPKLWLEMVDVRDVATAHVRAMTMSEANGMRHLLSSGGMWMQDIGKTIDKEFKKHGYNVSTMGAPKIMAQVYSLVDKTTKMLLPAIGLQQKLDTTRMTQVLGIEHRPPAESLVHMCYCMIEQGWVKKNKKYKGCPEVYR